MGEIEVPSQNFAEWFEELKSGCWDQDESYQALDRYLVTHVRGIRDSSFTVGTQDDWESDGFAPRPDVTSKQDEDLLLLEGLLDEEL